MNKKIIKALVEAGAIKKIRIVAEGSIVYVELNTGAGYLKVRVGYGTSAGYPSPYSTRGTLDTFTKMFQTAAGSIMNSNAVSNFYANPNLKPEIHKELELGIEGRFWKNRIGIDVSLYTKDSEDLIIDLELDPSTGYTSSTVNSAAILSLIHI